ncbi:TetR/AcrR family transcriptional regulator [Microbacterium sp.]|uniref:TetR/AcrR family transcriptional regulator n=1 Tax=Microbacterium sp. TaxID=51671 RepID=UPI002898D030|nr:TetR/AcrR family transcriptional regulator [Microbacterium sp.]
MDARARRSRESLRRAVIALSGRMPIATVTASAICLEAGVTRDTFYRHAANPEDLLADALSAEIDEIMARLPDVDAIGDAERALLTHVLACADVYRGAMNPILAAPVRAVIEGSIRSGLLVWAELHPHIVPVDIAGDASAMRIAVSYAAAGTVGAIEEWVRSGDSDVESAVRMILAASPEWWLR